MTSISLDLIEKSVLISFCEDCDVFLGKMTKSYFPIESTYRCSSQAAFSLPRVKKKSGHKTAFAGKISELFRNSTRMED